MQKPEGYRRKIYFAIIIIALGIVMTNTLGTSLGTVLIAIGGLFFISGMNDKRKADKKVEKG